MKVFLAGVEGEPYFQVANIAGINQTLFSYYHLSKSGEATKALFNDFNKSNMEFICDSGLFTLMFGSGKGGSYDLPFMIDYTKRYIKAAKSWGVKNLTIVESDVHKILGMDAVFELRKYFEDSGLDVLYVWHKEEGIDGLINMSKKYSYIAISVPELRILFKGNEIRYQDAVFNLLNTIRKENKTMPKIHLLGNTVQETMETSLAYSCDSTSWKAGCRYGRGIYFHGEKLKTIPISSPTYKEYSKSLLASFTKMQKEVFERYQKDTTREYMTVAMLAALSYKLYQDFLNKKYPWVGLQEQKNGTERKFTDITYREDKTKCLESKQAKRVYLRKRNELNP